jgi:hypothetical protein
MQRKQITRRGFLGSILTIGSGILLFTVRPASDLFHRWFSPTRPKGPSVLRMQPVPRVRYSRAGLNHMRNRIFLSHEAIVRELPHRGLIFATEQVTVSLSPTKLQELFGDSVSLDVRRHKDEPNYKKIMAAATKFSKVQRAA